MTYSCFYGTMPDLTDGGSAGMGALTDDVIYAPLGNPLANNTPFPADVCSTYFPGSTAIQVGVGAFLCEQHPIALAGAVIDETVTGGADFPAPTGQPKMIGSGDADGGAGAFPSSPTIVSVMSGTTNITGTNPLFGPLDVGDSVVNKNNDLTITWSCDGSATAGSGCSGTGDFLGVLIPTSTNTKGSFSTPTVTNFGVGQCVELVRKTGATATVTSAQLKALIGGQTGGSMQIAVVRLGVTVSQSGQHLVVYTAGHGLFGFTNL